MRTLGEICDEVKGIIRTGPFGSQLHESDYEDEGIPVAMPKDLAEGRVSTESIARVGADTAERLGQHRLQVGDIVYGRRGDIGRRALISEREAGWLCGTGCLRISVGDSVVDPTFLYYYLGDTGVTAWIANQAIGATLPNLNTTILRSVPIRYPALVAQRRIAAILSAYDDLIENNTRRIAILEEMARLLYREWFVHFRFPGHAHVAMVDSVLGPVPEGWDATTVGTIATIRRGRSYRGADIVDDGGLPFLNLKCVDRDGGFRYEGIKWYAGPYKEGQTARAGDTVIAVTDMTQERRIVGRAARVPDNGFDCWVLSMDLVKLEPAADVDRTYLYGLVRFSDFGDEVKHYANGANVLHLNPERIERYAFALPPAEARDLYGSSASNLFSLMDLLAKQNENLRRTRDFLLPKLISGELDVSALAIDPPRELTA
jgi:type I restriction enzyme S subunit